MTKVVDHRWYERNKHIFPTSVCTEFDPNMDYSNMVRRDMGGNAFFFRLRLLLGECDSEEKRLGTLAHLQGVS